MSAQPDTDRGQVNRSAAEVYQEFFVPALFDEWTERVTDAAAIQPGQHVLDVACGTGVLTRKAAQKVGETGSAVGLDINDGMLAVARRSAPQIEWRHGQAENLPFEERSFDAVVSQFGLMFFEDRAAAIREMVRVLKLGGHLAVAVWDSLENTPGYAAMVEILERLFGETVASGLQAPYILGDKAELRELFHQAGATDVTITTHQGQARFPSIDAWVYTDIKGWTLADAIDDEQFQTLLGAARKELSNFVTDDGSVAFRAPAHIITMTKQ